jgi:hypothetical protein
MLETVYDNEAMYYVLVFKWLKKSRGRCINPQNDPRRGWTSTTQIWKQMQKFVTCLDTVDPITGGGNCTLYGRLLVQFFTQFGKRKIVQVSF